MYTLWYLVVPLLGGLSFACAEGFFQGAFHIYIRRDIAVLLSCCVLLVVGIGVLWIDTKSARFNKIKRIFADRVDAFLNGSVPNGS